MLGRRVVSVKAGRPRNNRCSLPYLFSLVFYFIVNTIKWLIKEELRSPSSLVFIVSLYLLMLTSVCERGSGDYSFERIINIVIVWVFFVAATLKWALWCSRIMSFFAFPFAVYKFIFYTFIIDNPGDHVDSMVKMFSNIIFALPSTPLAIIGVILSGTVGVSGLLTFFKN